MSKTVVALTDADPSAEVLSSIGTRVRIAWIASFAGNLATPAEQRLLVAWFAAQGESGILGIGIQTEEILGLSDNVMAISAGDVPAFAQGLAVLFAVRDPAAPDAPPLEGKAAAALIENALRAGLAAQDAAFGPLQSGVIVKHWGDRILFGSVTMRAAVSATALLATAVGAVTLARKIL